MLDKAFELITGRVEKALLTQGFKRQKVTSNDDNELTALYISENAAYSIIYYKNKKHMVLSSAPMTDDGPSNDWKKVASWIFDPETADMKDAESIANDFCDIVGSAAAIKKVKQQKKIKKDDEGNATPMFFAKRLVALFPELRAEIKEENDSYEYFRGVAFAREKIVPKINALLRTGEKASIDKLSDILSVQYRNGDNDTRAIITIVILNSVDEQYFSVLEENMSKDLKAAWKAAKRFKGKTVKPEKIKKPKKSKELPPERLGDD